MTDRPTDFEEAFANAGMPAEVMTVKEIARAGGDIVVATRRFSNDDYQQMTTWQDVISALDGEYNFADEELGDGFTLLRDKDLLIGVPTVFIEWRFNQGDTGEYALCRVAATFPNGDTGFFILTDGSIGICDQLRTFTLKRGRAYGLITKRGLRRWDRDIDVRDPKTGEPTGKKIAATTYYIDTATA